MSQEILEAQLRQANKTEAEALARKVREVLG